MNRYRVNNAKEFFMKKIPLHGGSYALVDDEDYERVASYGNWLKSKKRNTEYAFCKKNTGQRNTSGQIKYKWVFMHRLILKARSGQHVDHINHNGLDNRKSNIRLACNLQNSQNRKPFKNSKSKYKGVYKKTKSGGWFSKLVYDGQKYYLGNYQTEEDAARAYNLKALELAGEFAFLNKVDMSVPAKKYEDQYKGKRKKITCINNGKVYDGYEQAAKDLGLRAGNIRQSVHRGGLCSGYEFKLEKRR